jgi:hypothetical protein
MSERAPAGYVTGLEAAGVEERATDDDDAEPPAFSSPPR